MRAIRRSIILATLLSSVVNAGPAMAGAQCALNVLTTLQLRPSSMPMIDAMIDDQPVALLVDTGGGMSSLTKVAVRELKLQTGQYVNSDGTILTLKNVAGETEALQVRLPSITLGRLRQEGVYFMVLPGDDNATTPRMEDFGGILGTDVLKNVDVELDFAAKKINLIAPNQCGGNVVHWQAPAVAVVPITLDRFGQITFRMQLDGRRVTAMLDTGASTTVLNLDTARRTFRIDVNAPDVERIGELVGGYTASTYRRRFNSIAFEGVTVSNPMIMMMPNMMGTVNPGAPRTGSMIRDDRNGLPDVILGMNVLSEMHVYIGYRERKLYITAASPQPASAPAAAPQ